MDYFTIFGLPFQYSIDLETLACRYHELQRQYHPDVFINQYKNNKLAALKQAITINVAYQSLKCPLKRAEYMLTIRGNIDINNEECIMHDTEFLMQQVSLYEELELIKISKQMNKLLVLFSSKLSKLITSYLQKMEEQINNEEWINVAKTIRELSFYKKLQQQVEQLEG